MQCLPKGAAGCRGESQDDKIVAELVGKTAESDRRGVLAYALPYQGSEIVVMYDRVGLAAGKFSRVGSVLGHVLAHEIERLLQGFARHSEPGVMKARWDAKDFDLMTYRPLSFTSEDIVFIQIGMAQRDWWPRRVLVGR